MGLWAQTLLSRSKLSGGEMHRVTQSASEGDWVTGLRKRFKVVTGEEAEPMCRSSGLHRENVAVLDSWAVILLALEVRICMQV